MASFIVCVCVSSDIKPVVKCVDEIPDFSQWPSGRPWTGKLKASIGYQIQQAHYTFGRIATGLKIVVSVYCMCKLTSGQCQIGGMICWF